ncbi:hypothetical protein HispidOSU_029371 [Sigmodon hispidus]
MLQETKHRTDLTEWESDNLTAKEKRQAWRHLTSPQRCAAQLTPWPLRTRPCSLYTLIGRCSAGDALLLVKARGGRDVEKLHSRSG